MPTKIDIISNALILIGNPPISSLDPDQGAGATVSALYETVLEDLLTTTYWRFAIKQQTLSKLSATPLNTWQFAYQIPTDSLAIHRVVERSRYQIFEDKIFSNENELAADYTFRVDDTALPTYFVKAFQYSLAADFAISVTNDLPKNQLYSAKLLSTLPIALAADARAHPPTPILDQPFTDIRVGGDFPGWGF